MESGPAAQWPGCSDLDRSSASTGVADQGPTTITYYDGTPIVEYGYSLAGHITTVTDATGDRSLRYDETGRHGSADTSARSARSAVTSNTYDGSDLAEPGGRTMTDRGLSRNAALRKVVAEGIEAVLLPAGFELARPLAWIRQTRELQHGVALLSRRGVYDIQWGIVSPGSAEVFWGAPADDGDIGASIVSGTPGTIHHPPDCQSFRLDAHVSADDAQRLASGVATDLHRVERRLRAFSTRHDVRSYLLLNREPKDRRDFVIPANLPLKLFTAATLAVLDRDAGAAALVAEAEQAMAPYKDELSVGRMRRLRHEFQNQRS
jgi:YD repeat-containing protein